jgi:hypothetical protein
VIARRLAIAVIGVVFLTGLAAAPAGASFGLRNLGLSFRDSGGSIATQAGSHPFELSTSVGVTTRVEPIGEVPEEEVKDLRVDLPAGFVGDRAAVPYCSAADFVDRSSDGRSGCPDSTALGIAAVKIASKAIPAGSGDIFLHLPVFNLIPPPGSAAKLGFMALSVPVTVDVGLSESAPYHLVARSTNIPQALLFYDAVLTVWGSPAAAVHDPLRGQCLSKDVTEMTEGPDSRGNCPVNIVEKPFLTLPRSCVGPPSALFTLTPWKLPRVPVSESAFTEDASVPPRPVGMTGCSSLGFAPRVSVQPTSTAAESPAGIDVALTVADEGLGAVGGIAQSDVKKAVVTLPEGVTVNPSAAEGLGACSLARYESESLSTESGKGCPESSKLGNVEVSTPLLAGEVLKGSLYQAQPDDPIAPGRENPFDTFLALYIVIRDPQNGILVKLAGKVEPDARTGQLISTFEDLPQFPFSNFKLHFREGPRSPLVTPARCGSYLTKALLTPWANPDNPVEATASFAVTSGIGGGSCPAAAASPFHPGFEAGSVSNNAGSFSPFNMRITRQDGEQDLTRLSSILPPGVVGKLAGVGRCPEPLLASASSKSGRQELASPSCPSSSQIGRVLVGAGVGSSLSYVPGRVYLAGPFAGDPLSVVVVTPAVAGPFDAGTVVTRVALALDPATAEVEIDGTASDPIPRILKGIPLKIRDLRIYADRPNFTLNPTSCNRESTRATLFGSFVDVFNPSDDRPVAVSDRYQAANCRALGFKPKLSLRLTGGTKRNDHPSLRAELRARPGDANIGGARVTLPPSEFIDNNHIQNPCTRVQFNAGQCPEGSLLGVARAFTPLLDDPLEGPVYFRSNGGERLLPDVVADLNGQFRIILVGHVDAVNGRIRTTFQVVPDAPVSKFVLKLNGGKRGLLVNSRNLCAHTLRAKVRFLAQNNMVQELSPALASSCKGKKARGREGSRSG